MHQRFHLNQPRSRIGGHTIGYQSGIHDDSFSGRFHIISSLWDKKNHSQNDNQIEKFLRHQQMGK